MFEYLYKHKDNLDKIKEFYWLISDIMPCEKCTIHFKLILTRNNIMSSNSWEYIRDFTIWLYNLMHKKKIIFLNGN